MRAVKTGDLADLHRGVRVAQQREAIFRNRLRDVGIGGGALFANGGLGGLAGEYQQHHSDDRDGHHRAQQQQLSIASRLTFPCPAPVARP